MSGLDWLTIGLLVFIAMFVGAGINEMVRDRDGRR